MEIEWQAKWAKREHEINEKFAEYKPLFTYSNGKRKGQLFQNWTGQSILQLAVDVEHEEAYDYFYSDLSSFTHADVRLASQSLRLQPDSVSWTQRANKRDVGEVLHAAAIFLTCYLKQFGSQFGVLDVATVETCWNTEGI